MPDKKQEKNGREAKGSRPRSRKTKIVCTIGPKTAAFAAIRRLAELGMNVARLNMSHSDQEWHLGVINHVKRYNRKFAGSVAIMLDTRGAEIRSGDLKRDLFLRAGDILVLTIRKQAELEPYCVEVSHDGFVDEVALGDIIMVDGGMLRLKVRAITSTDIRCESLDDGVIGSRRRLNVRGKSANLPAITKQDWADIDFGIAQRIDFIALSFVRTAETIIELKDYLSQRGVVIEILAKIESAAAILELDAIIAAADGVMIARGDLGAELPCEDVPLLQEAIIAKCRRAGKPVVVATHMLESMIINPTPTRAEVTDITHAVQQGADAIMLSGETATGRYPYKALELMDTVARRVERHQECQRMMTGKDVFWRIDAGEKDLSGWECLLAEHSRSNLAPFPPVSVPSRSPELPEIEITDPSRFQPTNRPAPLEDQALALGGRTFSRVEISRSAAILGNNLGAVGTLVITRRGLMAAILANHRPLAPIFAFTNTTRVRRRLEIYWGVEAFVINFSSDPERSVQRAVQHLLLKGIIRTGERVIVLSDILAGGLFVETVQVRVI